MNEKHNAELDLLVAHYLRVLFDNPEELHHLSPTELVHRALARNTIGCRIADLLIEMRQDSG